MKYTYQNYRDALSALDEYPQGSDEYKNAAAVADSVALELLKAGDPHIAGDIEDTLDQLYEIRGGVLDAKERTSINLEISKLDRQLRKYGFADQADRIRAIYCN